MAITPLPTPPSRDDPANFATRADAFLGALPDFATEANALAVQVNENATTAAADADIAEASASAALAVAGAELWVSGTTYAIGDAVWSPINLQTYRRKTNGAGTTDPSLDATNWASLGASGGISTVTTTTSATSITLTSSSTGYQSIAMTALGKHVTLPDATALTLGGPVFIIKNDGGYPFGIRDNAGTLIMGVVAGGIAYVTLQDKTTAAGLWSVTGDNLEPGLVTIDNTFSATYASTVLPQFVALDNNKSIHFLTNPSGHLYGVVVDNATSSMGTPVLITTVTKLNTAFKVSSTSAIIFFGNGVNNSQCVVASVSGTIISLGTPATAPDYSWVSEDFVQAPKIAQLTSTLYIASEAPGTTATTVVAVSVSGTTITIGSLTNIISSSSSTGSTTTYKLTDSTALVIYKSGAGPWRSNAVVVSVSGTTCTVGTPVACPSSDADNSASAPASCLLSATKAIVGYNESSATGYAYFCALTISGTTVTAGTAFNAHAIGVGNTMRYNFTNRYRPVLFPLSASTAFVYHQNSGISRVNVLIESGGTLTKGTTVFNSVRATSSTVDGRNGMYLPQSPTEFLSVGGMIPTASEMPPGTVELTTHKISGTTITTGLASGPVQSLGTVDYQYVTAVRLASGKQLISAGTNTHGPSTLAVVKSNGDAVAQLGGIRLPRLRSQYLPFNLEVAPDRIVAMVQPSASAIDAESTFQLRLLNVEIAK